jgi:prepilin-type N-terminal cleavage/methylation domain-containing protein/prepilin-type processing-associated H-X9-DG protein
LYGIQNKSKSKAFTLIEVVFAITIIAILLSILLPAMSSIKLSAQKVKDVSNLQKIAEAWREYTINRGNTMNLKQVSEQAGWSEFGMWFAFSLAGCVQDPNQFYPSKCVLNDPYVYVSQGDKYASKVLKEYVIRGASNTEGCDLAELTPWKRFINADFTISDGDYGGFWSYCTIGNLNGSVPLTTTPLAFTRGLKTDGTWDEKYGLYGTKGGYVVYCDGHVTWFDGSKPAKFLHWNGQEYTSDIQKAVPNVAKIGNGGVMGIPKGTYNDLIMWGNGTGGN